MGSTVVLAFEAPQFTWLVEPGEKVKMGQPIGYIEYDEEVEQITEVEYPEAVLGVVEEAVEESVEEPVEEAVEVVEVVEEPAEKSAEVVEVVEEPVEVIEEPTKETEEPVEVIEVVEEPIEVIEEPIEVVDIIEEPVKEEKPVERNACHLPLIHLEKTEEDNVWSIESENTVDNDLWLGGREIRPLLSVLFGGPSHSFVCSRQSNPAFTSAIETQSTQIISQNLIISSNHTAIIAVSNFTHKTTTRISSNKTTHITILE